MCQLVWAMVPSYLVKHYFGCFWVVPGKTNLYIVVLWVKEIALHYRGNCFNSNSAEVPDRTRLISPEVQELCQKMALNLSCNLGSSLKSPDPGLPYRFWTCQISTIAWANSLKSPFKYTYPIGSVSLSLRETDWVGRSYLKQLKTKLNKWNDGTENTGH